LSRLEKIGPQKMNICIYINFRRFFWKEEGITGINRLLNRAIFLTPHKHYRSWWKTGHKVFWVEKRCKCLYVLFSNLLPNNRLRLSGQYNFLKIQCSECAMKIQCSKRFWSMTTLNLYRITLSSVHDAFDKPRKVFFGRIKLNNVYVLTSPHLN